MSTVKQWIKIEGLEKKEILEKMGFKIDDDGVLLINGKRAKSVDGTAYVKLGDVKGVVPGSLSLIIDISEVELLEE
ncbi:MAG: hypothetical protein AAE983_04540 [Thermoplasmataceae archaeon]|jgi:hypothetical protein